jgi:D-alanyl-D-alanine carboxypeptidase
MSTQKERLYLLFQFISMITILSMLVGCGSSTPELEAVDYTSLPEGLSREEQVTYLMQECIVHTGGQPVHSFVLYAENKPEGILIHRGVGTVGNSDTPVDQEYQFKVASSSKPVVATIILQLMEEGKLNLDDPASKYLEEIAYLRFDELHVLNGESYSDEITIDHLLQHRTGFADIFTDTAARFYVGVFLHPHRQYSPEMIIEKYYAYRLNQKPHFKPGEGYYYSDINYVLLGLIIEQITGESLPEQIRQRVLEPLEMQDTYFEYYETETGNGKRLNSYQGRLNMTKYFNTSFDWGGGGLVSTTQDMATFIQALFGMELF